MPRTPTRPAHRRLEFEPLEDRILLSGGIADVFPVNPVNESAAMADSVLLQSVPGGTPFFSGVVAEALAHELPGPTGGCDTYEYLTEARAELSIAGTVSGSLVLSNAFAAAHTDGLTFNEPVAGVPTSGRVEHMKAQASLIVIGIGRLDAQVVGRVSLFEQEKCTLQLPGDEDTLTTVDVTVENEMRSSVNLFVRAQGSYTLTIVMYVSRETVLADQPIPALFFVSTTTIHESTGVLFAGMRSTGPLVVSGTGTVEWNEVFSDSSQGSALEGGRSHVVIDASGSAGVVAIELGGTANKYIASAGRRGNVFVVQYDATARVSGNGKNFSAMGTIATRAENFSGTDEDTATFLVGPANPVAELESQVLMSFDAGGLLPEVLKIRDDVLKQFPWL